MGVPEFDSLIAVLVGWPTWRHTVIFAFPRVARKIEISAYFKIHTLWQDMCPWIANSLRRLGVLLLFWLPRLWMKHLHLELQGSLSSNMLSGFFFGESAKVGGRRKGEKRTASFPPRVPNKMEVTTDFEVVYLTVHRIPQYSQRGTVKSTKSLFWPTWPIITSANN